ncbi:MAG: YfhO family protein [Chloroflexota bacterium]
MNRKQLAPLLILLALILLFFHKMAFSNLILARGDTFLYFYPYWSAAADALREGRIPLWNPDLFMGAPFLANSQVGFFYPLNWPLWLLLPTPYAVSATILLHLAIAGAGMFFVGQRFLGLGRWAALITAVSFTLSGYLTAQVEHVNQLQGMAWLPWFFVVIGDWELVDWRLGMKRAWWLALLFALQLFAGHTQTTFITIICLTIWLLTQLFSRFHVSSRATFSRFTFHVFPFALAGLAALALTAVQLLPTLQLSQLSSRQDGLTVNEVLSFSWNPLLAAHSLLPAYDQSLFSEYVAFLPIIVLLLAVVGAWQWRKETAVRFLLFLAIIGLLLALGQFNPLNWLLARLPGFNLFRAPARWLLLYTFAVSMLAGRGLADLSDLTTGSLKRPFTPATILIATLMLWGIASRFLANVIPTGAEAPYQPISLSTMGLWLLEILSVLLIGWLFTKRPMVAKVGVVVLITAVLFITSRSQPYNNLTTPEGYFDLRPPTTRLQAQNLGQIPPDRFLSLSHIFFDPGDQAEIDTIYADLLPEQARFDYTVAIKQKEIIGPNLPMIYGLPTVDGFDGGILPLASYSQFMQTLLLDGQPTTDGRLREFLTAVPAAHILDLLNVRYLITDKVGDQWRNGVFFDLQHPVSLQAGDDEISIGYLPDFEATELWLIVPEGSGEVIVETATATWQLTPERIEADLYRVAFPAPATLINVTFACGATNQEACVTWQIAGLTLVDNRDEAFQPLVLGNYRLIHSGDVKIYENLDVLPRAFTVTDWQTAPNALEQVAMLENVRETAVVLAADNIPNSPTSQSSAPTTTMTHYAPEQVTIQTSSDHPFLLILTDTLYPGWRVTIDAKPAAAHATNALFRGVFVPAGEHEVIWEFELVGMANGRLVTLLALIAWLFAGLILFRKPRSGPRSGPR